MLFQVEMDVNIPIGFDAEEGARLKAAEKARFQDLQRAGTWRPTTAGDSPRPWK